jgi:hypothetical protein
MAALRTLLIAAVLPAALPGPAQAWNNTGHMIIAALAWRELPEPARARITAVLRRHPHYDIFLKQDRPAGVPEDEWAFVRAATWADWVRPDPAGKKAGYITAYHRGPWHYINLPYIAAADRGRMREADHLPPRPNVVTAIEECAGKLRAAGTAADDRAVALAWLLHLVGDIHQPLHCTALVSSEYPRGDQGGNLIAVRLVKQVVKLHAYWDEMGGTSTDYKSIAATATKLAADPDLARDRLEELAKNTTAESWAREGRSAAEEFVYLKGALKSAPWSEFEAKRIAAEQVPALPADYRKNGRAVALRRMVLAGCRLADALKAATADK